MAYVKMYSTRYCPFCIMAMRLLEEKGVVIDIQRVDSQPMFRQEMERLRRRVHKLMWLNPLLGSPGYQPLCLGMKTALPPGLLSARAQPGQPGTPGEDP